MNPAPSQSGHSVRDSGSSGSHICHVHEQVGHISCQVQPHILHSSSPVPQHAEHGSACDSGSGYIGDSQ